MFNFLVARWRKIPIFINSRDQLKSLKSLVDWLLYAGHTRIIILDNASTYQPLLNWYDHLDGKRVRVLSLGENLGHKSIWKMDLPRRMEISGCFAYTDPDIIPSEDCPINAVEYFMDCISDFPDIAKIGFGLKIDDLPDTYMHKEKVILWERQFWTNMVRPGLYKAPIDTTFAVYRPGTRYDISLPSLRTGSPYTARHMTWYNDSLNPTEEYRYYVDHADHNIINWSLNALPTVLDEAIDRLKTNPHTR